MSVNVIRYYVKSQTKSVCLDLCEIMFNLCQIGKHKMLSMSLDMSISNWSLERQFIPDFSICPFKGHIKTVSCPGAHQRGCRIFLEMIQK